jgi:hypothetical protein
MVNKLDLDLLYSVKASFGEGVGVLLDGVPDELIDEMGLSRQVPILGSIDEEGIVEIWNAEEGEGFVVLDAERALLN